MGEAFGDGERCHLSISNADTLAIDNRSEARVEALQLAVVHDQISGKSIGVCLEEEMPAIGAEIVRLDHDTSPEVALDAKRPILHQRRHGVGLRPTYSDARSNQTAMTIYHIRDAGRRGKARRFSCAALSVGKTGERRPGVVDADVRTGK